MENDVLYNRIMNVVHKEYGEGSTAVANPEGTASDDLEKIQIGDEIYNIAGGGGTGGGAMIVTMSQDGDDTVLDKTYTEIKTAIESGIIPYMFMPPDLNNNIYIAYLTYYGYDNTYYGVEFSPIIVLGGEPMEFIADSEDGVLKLYQDN